VRGHEVSEDLHDKDGLQNHCAVGVIPIRQPDHEICGFEKDDQEENGIWPGNAWLHHVVCVAGWKNRRGRDQISYLRGHTDASAMQRAVQGRRFEKPPDNTSNKEINTLV
jgi:hypothetical protein